MTVGARIAAIRGSRSQEAFAKLLGIAKSTLVRYETDRRTPPADFFVKLNVLFGTDIAWLLTGKDFGPDPTNLALIPLYNVRVAAGDGVLVDEERVIGTRAFSRQWLSEELRMPADDLKLCVVHGDSMRPTLDDGDLVMVNVKETRLWRDDIYVLREDDHVMVKRLQRLPVGGFKVISDNPAYPPVTLMPAQAEDRKMAIVGRVVWWAHTNAR